MFARSGAIWAQAVQAWYPDFRRNYTSFPRKVLLGGDGWDGAGMTAEALRLVTSFAQRLTHFLQANQTRVDVSQHWKHTHGADTPSLDEMFNLTYGILTSVDQYNHVAVPLFADYRAAHRGRQPFINPGPLSRWQWGQANGGNASYEVAVQNMTIFRDWWETTGYGASNGASCSENLFVSIYSDGTTEYRDEYFEPSMTPPLGFSTGRIAVLAGAPEVVVPVGEAAYESRITMQTEYLPVTVALQMARGCDHVLAQLVTGLQRQGVLRAVGAGSRLYS